METNLTNGLSIAGRRVAPVEQQSGYTHKVEPALYVGSKPQTDGAVKEELETLKKRVSSLEATIRDLSSELLTLKERLNDESVTRVKGEETIQAAFDNFIGEAKTLSSLPIGTIIETNDDMTLEDVEKLGGHWIEVRA